MQGETKKAIRRSLTEERRGSSGPRPSDAKARLADVAAKESPDRQSDALIAGASTWSVTVGGEPYSVPTTFSGLRQK